ncbi:hypothetical protein [Cupriavidus pauculus]|uniref:Uncharacterized protein n=1 Tax=Cupriavidus pauculus TaxID=82633 RepID=A0A2N5CB54_9BURK|nr:hypothetical protein [Cupriavidus pauculus]PLP99443.1 hypothetical protein CYJ10_16585 [Cupriavidus pauculus]
MLKILAKTLLAAVVFAPGLSQTAHAGAFADALIVGASGHNGQRDVFSDGAHRPITDATMLPVVAQQGRSVCAVRGFDPYRDGLRKPDPYTDGGRISSRDGFTDGARSDVRDTAECLS